HMAHVQPPRNVTDLDGFALERKRRATSGDAKAFYLSERVDDLLGDAVAEELILGIRTQASKRQHGNRRRLFDRRDERLCQRGLAIVHRLVSLARLLRQALLHD